MEQSFLEKSEPFRWAVIAGDFVLLNVCMCIVWQLMSCGQSQSVEPVPLLDYILIANLCYFPAIFLFGIVLHRRVVRPDEIVSRLLCVLAVHGILFITVLELIKIVPISFDFLLSFYLLFVLVLSSWRLLLRYCVKRWRRGGHNLRRVALVGDGDAIDELLMVMENPDNGYEIVGVFGADRANQLQEWLSNHPVDELFCSLSAEKSQDAVLSLIRYCENHLIRFYLVPYVRNYVKRRLQFRLQGEIPVLSLYKEPLRKMSNRLIKRAFDLIVSAVFLCTVFPFLYIIVGIAIKLSSSGPIFFKQARNGENGKVFLCYKFRSMRQNADADKLQATKDDPRKTKVGNFLRKSNIDELPQFINVFKGDMSLVGPRPHMLKHTEEYSALINKYMMRHLIKPGITGWAQVTGFRGETKELSQMEGRIRRDLWYVENWSFVLDLRIMLMTVTNMFRGEKNAY